MMRWWWFGPSVTHDELEREMRAMKAGGIGGFEVQPVYPLALDDAAEASRTLPFSRTISSTPSASRPTRPRELGLRMDLTLGSGWPFGGPTVCRSRTPPQSCASSGATCRQARATCSVPDIGRR